MHFLLKLLTLTLKGLNILAQLSARKNSSDVQLDLGANKAGCNAGYNQFNFRVFQPDKMLPFSSQKKEDWQWAWLLCCGLEILSWTECFVAVLHYLFGTHFLILWMLNHFDDVVQIMVFESTNFSFDPIFIFSTFFISFYHWPPTIAGLALDNTVCCC